MKVRVLEMYSPLPRGAELSFAFHLQGFSPRNLKHMWTLLKHMANAGNCVQHAAAQLPWSHILTLLDKEPGGRDSYAAQSLEHGCFRNARAMQIDTHAYARPGASITNSDERLPPPQCDLPHQELKDSYMSDFLGLTQDTQERHIEQSCVHMRSRPQIGRSRRLVIGSREAAASSFADIRKTGIDEWQLSPPSNESSRP